MPGPGNIYHVDVFFVIIDLCCEEDLFTVGSKLHEDQLVVVIDDIDTFIGLAVQLANVSHLCHVLNQFHVFGFSGVDIDCSPSHDGRFLQGQIVSFFCCHYYSWLQFSVVLINGVRFGADHHCMLSEVQSLDIMIGLTVLKEVLAGDLPAAEVALHWESQVSGNCGIRWVLLTV